MTRTFLRTEETMNKYVEITKEREEKGVFYNPFSSDSEKVVEDFEHWKIIENDFPYDAVAKTSHMIATKRQIPFDWKLLNQEEIKEFENLRDGYIRENYDVIYENLPKGQTIPGHFHLHLLVLKREEM